MTGRRHLALDERVVLAAGIAMVGFAFLPWYAVHEAAGDILLRGWDLGFAAVAAVVVAVYAAGRVVVVAGRAARPGVPLTPAAETFAAAAAGLVAMTYRVLDAPDVSGAAVSRQTGLVLATATALAQAWFAGRALRRTGLRP